MTLALIPARGGSKGVKNKNMYIINNEPLIFWTIKAAKESKYIDKIVLSSDDDKILKFGNDCGIDTLKRPKKLAQDNSSTESVLLHAIKNNNNFDNFMILQPTSPLRTTKHINKAFKIFTKSNANALISVTQHDNKILKAFIINENGLTGICNNTYPFLPRQKLPKVYLSNGAIYIIKKDSFLQTNNLCPVNTKCFVMNDIDSLDCDSIEDLILAEQFLKLYS
ncbi:acylneuraminate cytidylyltransferase family protein [Helicobacter sp. WB40]|uniref:acylneuraminate cytidylyltransferase family protein n=1 Tax=Helicobacter sp. WB40 TaxID=3004130 RepID=UPI0022EBA8ED|nr:acylneuraminate cytidylyltransferase family protein [Helicobacter sp. WB40]MDA3966762.1 acylneuraminate cytidylyltransferase family protein [Helicobacter sp. WB40]